MSRLLNTLVLVLTGLAASHNTHASPVGVFPGLDGLFDTSDGVVVMDLYRLSATYSRTLPGMPLPYDGRVRKCLKGDIPVSEDLFTVGVHSFPITRAGDEKLGRGPHETRVPGRYVLFLRKVKIPDKGVKYVTHACEGSSLEISSRPGLHEYDLDGVELVSALLRDHILEKQRELKRLRKMVALVTEKEVPNKGIDANMLAQEAKPGPNRATLPLVPVFSTALDGPEFTLDYLNDTNDAVKTIDLLQGSSATLDGQVYPHGMIPGSAGKPMLEPGETLSRTINLKQYLPFAKFKQMGYSKTLKRWRWKTPLKPGKHTLLVKFGDKEYGPITFLWKGDVPLLCE
ncbi:MAG: hypothetical protein ACYSWU_02375 [Planctomycetota bacterium]|jgi:hypothetical protein